MCSTAFVAKTAPFLAVLRYLTGNDAETWKRVAMMSRERQHSSMCVCVCVCVEERCPVPLHVCVCVCCHRHRRSDVCSVTVLGTCLSVSFHCLFTAFSLPFFLCFVLFSLP